MGKKDLVVTPTPELPGPPHVTAAEELVSALESDIHQGLSEDAAASLLQKYGPNQIKPPAKPNPWKMLGKQIANAMTIVLLASMAVSFGTQSWIEAGVIAALVILNVATGFSQEWSAEKQVAALASVGSPTANVIRHTGAKASGDGHSKSIASEDCVPGDIIVLVNGDVVPADARVLPGYCSSLETDEALLTGESLPVSKKTEILSEVDCPVGDKKNMVFAGSTVTKGRGRCVITSTGMATELGKIAEAMERKETRKEKGWRAKWYKVKVALGVAGTSPLQIKLNTLAYILLGVALLLAFIVVASTAFVDVPFSIATYAVATAVSILPASLIAVVSLTLATASRELARRNALVRRMDAVEALSAVTDICSDKTGTITVGKMVLKKAWIPVTTAFPTDEDPATVDTQNGTAYSAESGSDPYYPRGVVRAIAPSTINSGAPHLRTVKEESSDVTAVPDEEKNEPDDEDDAAEDAIRPSEMEDGLRSLVLCASLCNMATIHREKDSDDSRWAASGDATEVALQVFAHKLGHGKPHLVKPKATNHGGQAKLKRMESRNSSSSARKVEMAGHYDMIVEHPFDSSVKRMSTAWKHIEEGNPKIPDLLIFMKGAVERVLDRCLYIGINKDTQVELTDDRRQDIISRMDQLAAEGLRVLALSAKYEPGSREEEYKTMPRDEMEKGFCFLGLVGIYDPPRPQSKGAVQDCIAAGIVPRMLTGDHPATARAISLAVGIIDNQSPKECVMTGQEFDALSEDQIDAMPELPLVIARCAPETKVRMVEALHRRLAHGVYRTTIMTGDGVNDCPALKRADIGVAMGLNGSDVAKGAADIVLADDNFSTIVRAIRKGRGVLANLSKFLLFLLSGNVAEVLVLLIGLAFQDEQGRSVYPLSPVAALWINTIAAGPPALALGLEMTASDAMIKRPEDFKTIFTVSWFVSVLATGVGIGALAIINFVIVVYGRGNGDLGRDCNINGYDSEQCELVYRGRGTAFATLVFILMIHAFHCKHETRSIFKISLLDNKILLWSAGVCALVTFPILYIPRISDYAFQLIGLGWEWGIIVAAILVYLIFAELWKWCARVALRRREAATGRVRVSPEVEKEMRTRNTIEPRAL